MKFPDCLNHRPVKSLSIRTTVSLLTILLFYLVPAFPSVLAQDSTKITYGIEMDTLTKQRFIDRYENVFMTKVPTRHMFKIGISQYYQPIQFSLIDDKLLNNSSLTFGYELKLLPAFSIALSAHLPFYSAAIPEKYVLKNVVYDAQLRWFFDMKKRIKKGQSANNFSGNYLAINYTLPGTHVVWENEPTIGIKAGFQRRLLNSGFVDYAFALQQRSLNFRYGLLYFWQFSTQISYGYAFGDWKKSRKRPLCDVLLCDENIRRQWKYKIPEVTLGYHLYRVRLGVAYEQKIKSSPFALNFQYDMSITKGYSYTKGPSKYMAYDTYASDNTKEISQFLTFQPRYYFLQKKDQLAGRGGNGLSGLYTGLNNELNLYIGKHNTLYDILYKRNTLYIGALIGFQQRLFRHGYLDFNTSYNFKHEFRQSHNSTGLRGNLGLGFAF
ncbi:hypothetical protein [Dyadobacter sp. CY356]|uniref:hypothetical protein n=1 Tax=Dyadobacter sp. CY356 TaxID=2906442 RepID=UPI001F2CA6B8|nr:hypothetical protein [Dyadobacter sp. CY356]MCF0057018.1 hypothetical protein [Dyadobacter sp. CY356]